MNRYTLSSTRLLRAPSILVLNVPRDGTSSTPLSNLFHFVIMTLKIWMYEWWCWLKYETAISIQITQSKTEIVLSLICNNQKENEISWQILLQYFKMTWKIFQLWLEFEPITLQIEINWSDWLAFYWLIPKTGSKIGREKICFIQWEVKWVSIKMCCIISEAY